MGKRKIITPEEHDEMLLSSSIRDIENKILFKQISSPTRFFSIDERVYYGAHKEVYINDIHRDGMYYTVLCVGVKRDRDKPPRNEKHIVAWHDLFLYKDRKSVV